MLDPVNVPEVEDDEQLSRFVLTRRHVRSDGTVKPDAFVPHPHEGLSVNRRRDATDAEMWKIGRAIAKNCKKLLMERRKFWLQQSDCSSCGLSRTRSPAATQHARTAI